MIHSGPSGEEAGHTLFVQFALASSRPLTHVKCTAGNLFLEFGVGVLYVNLDVFFLFLFFSECMVYPFQNKPRDTHFVNAERDG